ncbi:spore coat protein U domain-containing protein, partial [Acinetobacter variabilis]|uniref:spore coat protein U domain-containing protein n=2 Tax=Moraxellaceae TaxID=468 RepID=UPI0030F71390
CIITTTPLAFGAYNPVTSATLDATGNINVACTNGTAGAYITLSEGENSLDSINRRLTDGANFLPYTLSSDSNRSQVWLPS